MNRKPGDWNCPKCDFVIFASKPKCLKCNVYKNDWKCANCNTFTKQSSANCFRCNAAKPGAPADGIQQQPVAAIGNQTQQVTAPKARRGGGGRKNKKQHHAAEPELPPQPQLEKEDECSVCLDAKKDTVIIPCGHLCVCNPCATVLAVTNSYKCPICRGEIEGVCRAFQ